MRLYMLSAFSGVAVVAKIRGIAQIILLAQTAYDVMPLPRECNVFPARLTVAVSTFDDFFSPIGFINAFQVFPTVAG
jgi:hypothetical protein